MKIALFKEQKYMMLCLVIITQNQQKMHNLGELKSRQFFRRPSIEPITRASSFHTIDNRRNERIIKLKYKEIDNENIIDLASIMHQIQQLKPKTAHRIEQNTVSRNRRAETIVPGIPKLKSKNNLVSIIDILKEQRQTKDQYRNLNTVQQKGEQKINRKIVIQRKSHDKNLNLKRKSEQGRESQINFQTINFPQGVCRANDKDSLQKVNLKSQYELDQTEGQNKREKIIKNMTEYGFKPQNKITINNIDKLIFLNPKETKNYKDTKRTEKDAIIKLNQQQKLLIEKQLENQQQLKPIIETKQKKVISNTKIPQFIKASLQAYKQQSKYSNFIIPKTNQNKTLGHRDEQHPIQLKAQNVQNVNQANDVQILQKRSEQNVLGAKLNLSQKQKKRSNKVIDYIRQKRQNNTIAVQSVKTIFKINSRSKQKRNQVQEDFNHKICGWEQNDAPVGDPIYFKL